jgi:hypothetical protein
LASTELGESQHDSPIRRRLEAEEWSSPPTHNGGIGKSGARSRERVDVSNGSAIDPRQKRKIGIALCLLLCSGSFGASRGTRADKRGREVGILLGIETEEGTSIGSEVTGKPLAMNPSLDGGSARIREYASLWFVPFGNRRLRQATKTQPGIRK